MPPGEETQAAAGKNDVGTHQAPEEGWGPRAGSLQDGHSTDTNPSPRQKETGAPAENSAVLIQPEGFGSRSKTAERGRAPVNRTGEGS